LGMMKRKNKAAQTKDCQKKYQAE
jgi:hypothetical protein